MQGSGDPTLDSSVQRVVEHAARVVVGIDAPVVVLGRISETLSARCRRRFRPDRTNGPFGDRMGPLRDVRHVRSRSAVAPRRSDKGRYPTDVGSWAGGGALRPHIGPGSRVGAVDQGRTEAAEREAAAEPVLLRYKPSSGTVSENERR